MALILFSKKYFLGGGISDEGGTWDRGGEIYVRNSSDVLGVWTSFSDRVMYDQLDARTDFPIIIFNNSKHDGTPAWLDGVEMQVDATTISNISITGSQPTGGGSGRYRWAGCSGDNGCAATIQLDYKGTTYHFTLSKPAGSHTLTVGPWVEGVGGVTGSGRCTEGCEEAAVKQQTKDSIRNLSGKHAVNMTSQGPALSGLMTGVGFGGQSLGSSGGAAGNLLPIGFSYNKHDTGSSGSFALSLNNMLAWQQALNAGEAKPGEERLPGLDQPVVSPVNVWAKGRWTEASEDRGGIDQKSKFGMVFVGADYRYNKDLILGLLAQMDWFDEKSSTFGTEGEGQGWMFGPYLVSRLNDDLVLDARVAWGQSDNKVSPLGTYTDDYDTERWQIETNLTGSLDYNNWHIAPAVGLIYYEETQKAYTDSNGFTIGQQSNALGSLNFGPTFYYNWQKVDGTLLRPMFGLKGVWDFDAPDITDINGTAIGTEGLRGQARIGMNATTTSGTSFQGSYTYDGIGVSAFESHTLEMVVSTPINISGLPKGIRLNGSYAMFGKNMLSSFSNPDGGAQSMQLELAIPFD